MKKKLLSTVFALAMGATCAIGFTACGGDGDKETAEKAVNYIKALYENKAEETAESYTVMGVAPVDGTNHTVNWSVAKAESCTVNDISAYVSVGAMDEKKQVPVTIAKADVEIPYVLTASVKVGKKTAKVDFNRKVPAKAKNAAGTKEDPYSAARVMEIASTMTPKAKLEASDNPVAVYVEGYIVDCGKDSAGNNRVGYVYIVDEYSADKDSSSPDALMILSINYDSTNLTGFNDLEKGKKIMVKGYIMNYQKAGTTTTQPEITYYDTNGITCEYLEKTEKTPDQKITLALSGVSATMVVNKTGDTALPASSVADVTFSYEVTSGTAATVSGTNLNVATLPAEDATVVVKITATCGNATAQTKDVTVTVKAASVIEGGVKFDFAAIAKGDELNAETALALLNSVGGSDAGLTAVAVTKVYQGNGTGGKPYENQGGLIKFGTSKVAGEMTLTFDKQVTKVEINCVGWVATDKISVNGADGQTLNKVDGDKKDCVFELATASNEVKITTDLRALVFSITVYFAD